MSKFVKLYESAISRYTRGGFLTGDLVKFSPEAWKNDFFRKQAPNYIDRAKDFNNCGLNLRVSAVKAVRPTIHSGDIQNEADEFLVDITRELAPGLYKDFLTVPASCLVHLDSYPNLAPVPDSLKRKNNVNIDPKQLEQEKAESILRPFRQTLTSDVGDGKDNPGDRKLLNTNTKIPSDTAKGEKTPLVNPNFPLPGASTAKYLPKK